MKAASVQLDRAIHSVELLDEKAITQLLSKQTRQETAQHQERIDSLCQTLQQVITAAEQSYQQLFVKQKENIVRLSIDIAAKILKKKIQEGHYDIEKIVQQAIEPIGISAHIIVRLNPKDLAVLRQAVKNNTLDLPDNLQFVDDTNIGCGECIVESDQGIVEYLIEEHLKQVEAVLMEPSHPVKTL